MQDKNLRDILGGLLMLGIGLFFALYGGQYSFGSLARMGPGYFPVVLGWVLVALGVLIILPALREPRTPMPFAIGNFLWVFSSLLLFAYTLPRLGLVPSAFVASLVCSMADKSASWVLRIGVAVGVGVLSALIFKVGLGMILPLFWWEG
ncbi:MAG: tripartite tricarboxylate transporter TctB family protein [Pseudomonadota bacterium]|nr:tripartite tricarboxylate transporter TctB family protein [Pseudomonadota bacterium]